MPSLSSQEVLSRVGALADGLVRANADRVDRNAEWPEENLRALLGAGLGGLVIPEAQGGLGHGMRTLAQVCERLGRECGSTALVFGMHCVGAAVLSAKATPGQRERFLDPISRGEHITTLALSEPGTGVHFYLPQTELLPDAEGFRIRGRKAFVTSGGHADSYVVSTTASTPDAGPGDFSCVVVPKDSPGLTWAGDWLGIGMRGNSARGAMLDDVRIPLDSLLGQEGDEIWLVFRVVAPYFIVAMAGTYLGIAASALDVAREHLKARAHSHSGQTLSQSSVMQHRIGSIWAAVERTRLLLHHASQLGDTGAPDALAALCSSKAEVGDTAVHVVNEAMTIAGGLGYSESGSPLFRHLRDARAAHVMSPTTDLLRLWAGRALLGLPLLGD